MKTQVGLYVTLFPDGRIRKEIVDNSGETVKFETSVAHDLLYYANMLYEPYENVIGYIKKLFGENDMNTLEASAKIFILLNGMVCQLYENNPVSGILLNFYLANTNHSIVTAEMMYDAFAKCINAVATAQVIIINALRDLTLGITPDMENKYRCIKEYYFMEHIDFGGAQNSRRYYFQLESSYMIFLLAKFIENRNLISCCRCCGRFFIPKTKKTTLYCDRIYLEEKTCKEIAPRMKHKALASKECVIQEYDRAKQRMYKRYERTLDGKKPSGKDLSYQDYITWLDTATAARDQFLAGELAEKEALESIVVGR